MPPSIWFRGGGAHSLAREGVGESQFRRGDIHCGTLFIYMYFSHVRTCMRTPFYKRIHWSKFGKFSSHKWKFGREWVLSHVRGSFPIDEIGECIFCLFYLVRACLLLLQCSKFWWNYATLFTLPITFVFCLIFYLCRMFRTVDIT